MAGFGTALKPAWEPVILARNPLAGTVAETVLAHGTGALNIDGSRVGTEERFNPPSRKAATAELGSFENCAGEGSTVAGRWPSNLIHDGSDEVLAAMPEEAARFFYCAKAARSEREEELDGMAPVQAHEVTGRKAGSPGQMSAHAGVSGSRARLNDHPTVKPVALMRYLCRLLAPPAGGTVLDPFMGSGSTMRAAKDLGLRAIGVELEERYCEIAARRLAQGVLFAQ